jgi:hypothetical protein
MDLVFAPSRVESWPITRLRPYAPQCQDGCDDQLAMIAASIARFPDSVFRIMRHKGGLGAAGSHPAVFPVALVEAVREAFTDPGELVFEPFCGSGAQLIAAERKGGRCFAVELDPVYCDVAVRRWEMATGRIALHQAMHRID